MEALISFGCITLLGQSWEASCQVAVVVFSVSSPWGIGSMLCDNDDPESRQEVHTNDARWVEVPWQDKEMAGNLLVPSNS